MTKRRRLARLLSEAGSILMDFDGPVCAVFAGYTALTVATELRQVLHNRGVALPDPLHDERDPLTLLRWSVTLGRAEITRDLENTLREAELRAVDTAQPTPYAREAIVAAHQTERRVAIVSNNSELAITAYLKRRRLTSHIDAVVGRVPYHPERMKPDPDPLYRAAAAVDTQPSECLLIGDSRTDVEAAQVAGVPVIALADKPHKHEIFDRAKADIIVTTMADIALILIDAPNS